MHCGNPCLFWGHCYGGEKSGYPYQVNLLNLCEIIWLELLKEAKSLDYQMFRIFQMLAGGWYRGPGVTLRSPLAISLSFASAFVLSERACSGAIC